VELVDLAFGTYDDNTNTCKMNCRYSAGWLPVVSPEDYAKTIVVVIPNAADI
jgi:hypothetical protein